MRITIVAGARPNFMKIAPIIREIEKPSNRDKITFDLVHTGQHYDNNMSENFFKQLGIPKPKINLGCGGGTQAEITSKIMVSFENFLTHNLSDLVLVVGDVTSTMACAIVARKLKINVAHVEAGIRSYDWSMPEEINRVVTDSITNHFFTTSEKANENLLKSGVQEKDIFFVGNTMIDTLLYQKRNFQKPKFWNQIGLSKNKYIVLTIHRPSNVDDKIRLKKIITKLISSSRGYKIIFPMHPRTKKLFKNLNLSFENLYVIDPLPYLEFNFLVMNSLCVITDSGGITEETTVLGIPCITLRKSTERPETVEIGTNELIGDDPNAFKPTLNKIFNGIWKEGTIPKFWDGLAAPRIIKNLLRIYNND